ncbi:TerD family protein [Tsukamurella pseudospumae]|uniref:Stress protein n=1 Tax=Tsukamurella pseudospumae TaxID=239498 RepID=A0A138AUG6_9ACTN|nr:TerD family protein [Tsukamurella pseudospumae]KXP14090.1 stress protein [Tsukamurella pseudospumae]
MTALSKGQNGPLPAGPVTVTVELPAPADVSALLVTESGKVRSDADFVFFNQPNGPGVSLGGGALRIDGSQLPADITQVRVAITLDDASSSFGRFGAPVARIADGAGNPLYEYAVDGLSSESVVIAVEVYRRGADWKVRAVGQGYAGGFADMVRDHGVSVDDAPAAQAPAATPPPAPPQPAAPSNPVPPAPAQNTPPAPSSTPIDYFASGAAPSAPAGSAPVDYFNGPAPQTPAPQAPPQQPFTPTAQLAGQQPPSGSGEVSLTKNRRVDLTKGQKVVLRKDGGVQLTQIAMGLGWDPVRKQGLFGAKSKDIDLDASVVMFSGQQKVDTVYFGDLRSKDGSVQHQGDNLTGAGDGDDEVINVDLPTVNAAVTSLVFIVTSYQGQKFDQVDNAYCRLVDSTTGVELARFALAGGMPYTGIVMCTIGRQGGEWKLQAIGECINAKTPRDAVPQLTRFLA